MSTEELGPHVTRAMESLAKAEKTTFLADLVDHISDAVKALAEDADPDEKGFQEAVKRLNEIATRRRWEGELKALRTRTTELENSMAAFLKKHSQR